MVDASANAILFEDVFSVSKLNPEGKKFDRTDRVSCKGEIYEADLLLDIPSEIFSLKLGEKFTLAIASTLRLDGAPDSDYYEPDEKPSLLDKYDLGMCGKVFKYEYMDDNRVAVVASFGGLLILLQGEQRHLLRIQLDQKVYCLIRKGAAGGR